MLCPFCPIDSQRILFRHSVGSASVVALWDGFPVSPGHLLIVPVRHVPTWFDASPEEHQALTGALEIAKSHIESQYQPQGYNIGINVGAAAGQTVSHLHVHLIPRYHGDVPDPRGGVRHVIPQLANYLAENSPDYLINKTSYRSGASSHFPRPEFCVSYDTKRTRIHAKAYLFREKTRACPGLLSTVSVHYFLISVFDALPSLSFVATITVLLYNLFFTSFLLDRFIGVIGCMG